MLELTHGVTSYATCKYRTWELGCMGVALARLMLVMHIAN